MQVEPQIICLRTGLRCIEKVFLKNNKEGKGVARSFFEKSCSKTWKPQKYKEAPPNTVFRQSQEKYLAT